MSIWTRITEALSALTTGEGLSAVFDRLRSPPERSVGVAAVCDADRKAIWALLKHVRAKCGLDRAGAP